MDVGDRGWQCLYRFLFFLFYVLIAKGLGEGEVWLIIPAEFFEPTLHTPDFGIVVLGGHVWRNELPLWNPELMTLLYLAVFNRM